MAPPTPGLRFFVPGLPESVREPELQAHFGRYGPLVEVVLAKEKGSEVSKGFGYVTFETGTNPDPVLNDEHSLGGQALRALLDKDKLQGSSVHKVHISNCEHLSTEEIRLAFAQFGQIWDVHTPKDPNTKQRLRYGFVTFSTEEALQKACDATELEIGGQRITIKPAAQTGDASFGKGGWEGWGGNGPWDAWGGGGGAWGAKGGAKKGGGGGGLGERPAGPEGTRYFLSNLPEGVPEDPLKAHFAKYGKVLEVIIVREKGQSRGFAYVTLEDAASRDTILADRHEILGQEVSVLLSKEHLVDEDPKKVHVDNCEFVSAEALREACMRFGPVLDVHTPRDPRDGSRKKFGFVTFASDEAMNQCIAAGTLQVPDTDGTPTAVVVKAASRGGSTILPKGKGKGGWDGWGKGGGGWDDWSSCGGGGGWCGGKGGGDMWGGKGGGCQWGGCSKGGWGDGWGGGDAWGGGGKGGKDAGWGGKGGGGKSFDGWGAPSGKGGGWGAAPAKGKGKGGPKGGDAWGGGGKGQGYGPQFGGWASGRPAPW